MHASMLACSSDTPRQRAAAIIRKPAAQWVCDTKGCHTHADPNRRAVQPACEKSDSTGRSGPPATPAASGESGKRPVRARAGPGPPAARCAGPPARARQINRNRSTAGQAALQSDRRRFSGPGHLGGPGHRLRPHHQQPALAFRRRRETSRCRKKRRRGGGPGWWGRRRRTAPAAP